MGPAYRVAAHLLHRLPYPRGTLATSLAGRRDARARWLAWAAASRGPGPLIWAHAASVGEAVALLPVVSRLRVRTRALSVVLTHTSPSPSGHPAVAGFDHVDFLPLDEPRPMTAMLDSLRPAVLLFSRGDLWPELVSGAAAAGVPVAVAGAAVRLGSARLRAPAVWALRRVHRSVAWLGAISEDDASRWRTLGVPSERVAVTGDPRHDQVVERIPSLGPAHLWRGATRGGLTIVAGSVEPDDDALLAGAAAQAGTDWRWLVVPHTTEPARVQRLEKAFDRWGQALARWDAESTPPSGAVVLVTRRGPLADLYWAADVAYVGGGFRAGALHAVCEAAVASLPIVTGPLLATVRDGALLEAAGGATPAGDAGTLTNLLDTLASSGELRWRAGLAARTTLETGAANLTAAAVAGLARLTD